MQTNSDAAFPINSLHSFIRPKNGNQGNQQEPSTSSSDRSFPGPEFSGNFPLKGRTEFHPARAFRFYSQDEEMYGENPLSLERKTNRRDSGFDEASMIFSIPGLCKPNSSKDGGIDINSGRSPSSPSEIEVPDGGASLWGRKRGRTISDIGSIRRKRKSIESGNAGKMDEGCPESTAEQAGAPMHWCSKVDIY